jgi:hypothetical protein
VNGAARLRVRLRRDGHQHEGERDEREVQRGLLAARAKPRRDVRVRVTQKEERLEEEQTGGPDGGATAEPRQNHLAHERLDLEE